MVDIVKMKSFLDGNVMEQDFAKENILNAFSINSLDDSKVNPISFLFCGDKSSGKTHLSEAIGAYFKSNHEYSTFSLDMGRYTNDNQSMDIIGVEYGYSTPGVGKLTSHIYKNPKTVLILENLDSSHHGVQKTIIDLMTIGKICDSFGFLKKGETIGYDDEEILTKNNYCEALEEDKILYDVDCKEVIVIITTRKGEEVYKKPKFIENIKDNNNSVLEMLLENIINSSSYSSDDLKYTQGFSPYITSVLSETCLVPLFPLEFKATISLMKTLLLQKIDQFSKINNIDISFENLDSIIKTLTLSEGPNFDIRKIKQNLIRKLFAPILKSVNGKYKLDKIKINIDQNSNTNLQDILDGLPKNDIFKGMFRKNSSANISFKTRRNQKTLFVALHVDSELNKIVKAEEYDSKDKRSFVFDIPEVSFSEIAGHEDVKKHLKEIHKFLKNPSQLKEHGVHTPKGMLLYGIPGTGKTMLAKAFANYAELPFIATTGTEMLDLKVMEDIFKKAKEYAPSVIFIDELDAIGKRNGEHRDIVINQLLTELDGFSSVSYEQVFVITATNYKEKIDSAILRSERIDIHIEVPILDKAARTFFINQILNDTTETNIDKEKLVMITAGMSGADLTKIKRESFLEVIRQDRQNLTEEIIVEQINKLKYGEKIFSESIKNNLCKVALHEAGHAVISKILRPTVQVEQVVVSPRSNSLGFVSYSFEENYGSITYEEIKNRICIAYAGRLAQVYKYADEGLDSGAANDLETAMRYAYIAVGVLGMDAKLGYINVNIKNPTDYFETKIQESVHVLLEELKSKTEELVKNNWFLINEVAKILIKNEFIDDQQINTILMQNNLKKAS